MRAAFGNPKDHACGISCHYICVQGVNTENQTFSTGRKWEVIHTLDCEQHGAGTMFVLFATVPSGPGIESVLNKYLINK